MAAPASASNAPRLAEADGAATLLVGFAHGTPADSARAALSGIGDVTPTVPEAGVWSLRVPPGPGVRARVLARPGVTDAWWSLRRGTAARRTAYAAPATPLALTPVAPPTDPYFADGRQWALLPPATSWGIDLTGTPPRPRIAVLDSGIDSSHPEWSGPNSPLVAPYSAWTERPSAEDWGKTGHGTHVAGTAAAPANGLGVVGVAPGARGTAEVIPVQISDRDGYSTDDTMMKGIRWSVRNGAKVINISAGGAGRSAAFQRVVDWASRSGALIVASVGNDGQDHAPVNFPAAYQGVLGVAAQCGARADPVDCPTPYGLARFSNRNASVDVLAPGVDIISSVPPRVKQGEVAPGYAVKEGTSMAAPFVAGVAALVFAANPGATPFQVLRQIKNTATDMGPAGRDPGTGAGVVNPRAAITLPLPPDDASEPNPDIPAASREAALRPVTAITAFAAADDDPVDVVPVVLRAGQVVRLSVRASGMKLALALWPPGTRTITTGSPAATTPGASGTPRLARRVERSGRWYVEVRARAGSGPYRLTIGR